MSSPPPVGNLNHIRLRPSERRTLLIVGDLFMAILALLVALYFWSRGDQWMDFSWEFFRDRPPDWFFLLPAMWVVLLVELYDIHRAGEWRSTLRGIAQSAIIGLGLYLIFYFFYETPKELPRRGVVGFVIAAPLLTLLWRVIYLRVFTAPQFLRRVLLVGGGETGSIILKIIQGLRPPPFLLIGIVDDDPLKHNTVIESQRVVGDSAQLPDLINEHKISDLIVAISGKMQPGMFQALLDAQEQGVEITRMPVAYEELLGRVPISYLEPDWILRSFVDQARVNGLYELAKRALDILGGLVGCAILLAFLPLIGLATLLDTGLPIFYTQTRLGRGGHSYHIIKFRTMKRNAEPNGQPQWAEENDVRATRVGRLLRKTHLDELPQFINVLRGEMSLVGPRAERPELIAWFQQHVPFYRARLIVKPGITGWAQVNYGYAATVDETIVKLEYDLYYIKRRTLIMDIVILLRTPATILGLRGR